MRAYDHFIIWLFYFALFSATWNFFRDATSWATSQQQQLVKDRVWHWVVLNGLLGWVFVFLLVAYTGLLIKVGYYG